MFYSILHVLFYTVCMSFNISREYAFYIQSETIIMCNKIYFSDEYMVLPENASNIISYRSKVPSAKEEWALNLKEDDNPCLYFYTWK